MDLSPLRDSASYRRLFFSQLVSFIGSAVTTVAVPYQIYEMTRSNAWVGAVGIAQLVPLMVSALWGGVLADRFSRIKLILWTEGLQTMATLGLATAATLNFRSIPLLYALSGVIAFLEGIHRPAMAAVLPLTVPPEKMAAAGALAGFRVTFGSVIAPAFAGILISRIGVAATYWLDAVSYIASMILISRVRVDFLVQASHAAQGALANMIDGLRYLWGRKDILASYGIDIAANVFAYPILLFPALAEQNGGGQALGFLHSSLWCGAMIATLSSGWMAKPKRQMSWIAGSAAVWCLCISLAGLQQNFWFLLMFMALAGYADMVSAIFRHTFWNKTIASEYRGRLGGIELLSFKSGPMIGGFFLGGVAQATSAQTALFWGGLVGIVLVYLCRMRVLDR